MVMGKIILISLRIGRTMLNIHSCDQTHGKLKRKFGTNGSKIPFTQK